MSEEQTTLPLINLTAATPAVGDTIRLAAGSNRGSRAWAETSSKRRRI